MRYLYFSIILIFSFKTSAQNQDKINAINKEILESKIDSIKIEKYLDLYYEYHRVDQNKSLEYTILAENLSKKGNDKYRLAKSKFRKGSALESLGFIVESEKEFNSALSIFNEIGNVQYVSAIKIELAQLYRKQSNYDSALILYMEALELSKELEKKNEEARIYNYLGSLNKILKQYDKAIDNYKSALVLVTELNFNPGISACLSNLGLVFLEIERYDDAIVYLIRALKLKEKIGDKLGASRVHQNLSNLYMQKKDFEKAKTHVNKSILLAIEVNNKNQIRQLKYILAEINFHQDKYTESINLLDSLAIELKSHHDLELEIKTHKLLVDNYENKKDYVKAFKSTKTYIELSDNLFNEKIVLATNEIESKYQTKEKVKEITLLTTKNELAQQQNKNQRFLFIASLILTMILGLFFFFQYRNRNRTNKKLKELDKVKSDFFANISHEFRTPLTLISGPIQEQLKKVDLNSDSRKHFEMMDRNTNKLLSLVDQLLDLSKIESGNLELKISKDKYLFSLIGVVIDSFAIELQRKSIRFNSKIEAKNTDTWYDKDVVEKIVTNLMSNAVKYTPINGTIELEVFVENSNLLIKLKNTGNTLSKEQLKNVFKRFYKVNTNEPGVGIGLALVKELIALHKGKVSVQNIHDKWILFSIVLPISKDAFSSNKHLNKTNLVSSENTSNDEANNITSNIPIIDNDKPILLIIDDNTDIRSYISSLFEKDYTIIQAEHGEIGVNLALKHVPDVIICDVMMPVKDGIEVCSTLKLDQKTSHIPIILLTAKAGEENQIEGVKTGADDYIIKPFNTELLVLKVDKLVELRKVLRERFSRDDIILNPKTIAVNSIDEDFLNRIQNIFDDRLNDASFSINEFCKAAAMSRMQLHRKLKALTGLSTSEFIRNQRLKYAAQLLKTSDINVSQIGYSVGFNDHAYFSKCFKDVFNCTPTEYSKKK